MNTLRVSLRTVMALAGTSIFFISSIQAGMRSRKPGIISQALQAPDLSRNSAPIKMASTDKLSNYFEDKRTFKDVDDLEIPQPQIDTIYPGGPESNPEQEQTPQEKLPEGMHIDEKAVRAALQTVEKQVDEDETLEMNFQDAELTQLADIIQEFFKLEPFLSADIIEPLPKGQKDLPARSLKGNKITFKTNKPLSRKEAWDLFITFLDIAGFMVEPTANDRQYKIVTIKEAQRAPVPTYLGINPDLLPDNDEMIRYLYFIENASIDAMKSVIPSLQSASAGSPIFLQEHKAFILTDKAYNIKSLMKIVKELDKGTMPEVMSVLKLKQVDAEDVRKLYEELTQTGGENKSPFQPWGARKQPTAIYFPENARMIAEPRTNALILLGPKDAIAKIEDFITKYIDVDLDQPYSPLFPVQLQYADAKVVAEIMNTTTKFGQGTEAAKSGGVRGRDKYLRQMTFTAEPATNQIIVRGDYEDFLIAKEIIQKLDEPQPQVALDVMIVSINLLDTKGLGTQIRSKVTQAFPALAGLLGQNVVFQTSGLNVGNGAQGIQTNSDGPGFQRLLGNLINLVTQAPAGNTIVTFGQDLYGVWGLFQILRTITNTQVLSNPFLIVTNKSPARVQVGETRRVTSQTTFTNTTQPVQGLSDDTAALQVDITPQINSDGMILLNLQVNLSEFTDPTNQSSGNKNTKLVKTQAIIADREVLALGGLIRDKVGDAITKVPIFGDIPIIGRLFKNQSQDTEKISLLVLVSAKIIPPHSTNEINQFTQDHMKTFRIGLEAGLSRADRHDPIHKMFFAQQDDTADISNEIFKRHGQGKSKRKRKKSKQEVVEQKQPAETESIMLSQNKTPLSVSPMSQQTREAIAQQSVTPQQALAYHKPESTEPSVIKRKRRLPSLSNFLSPQNPEEHA